MIHLQRTLSMLLITALLLTATNCATTRKHPVIVGLAVGTSVGLTIALVTRHNCPHRINGVPYDGTAPCPKYWPDPKRSK